MSKKIFTTLLLVFSLSLCKAQWVTIPDANFVAWLQTNYPTCMNGNLMDTTCSGIVNATSVMCPNQSISDITGIQYFDNLEFFLCVHNQIVSIPNLSNSLVKLYCAYNNLTSLPILPNTLSDLDCSANQIAILPSLPNGIDTINCSGNQLLTLPVLPASLKYLDCSFNQIASIPLLPSPLIHFVCQYNLLSNLPSFPNGIDYIECRNNLISNLPPLPSGLTYFDCAFNQITSLPSLPNSISDLSCAVNQLNNLPTLPLSLQTMSCFGNSISYLPSLPNSLTGIDCGSNQLTSLPTLPNTLAYLNCEWNSLSSLPPLPVFLEYIQCSYNQLTTLPPLPNKLKNLYCYNNQLSSLPVLPDTLEVFNVSGNLNLDCMPPLYFLTGNIFNIGYTGIECLPNIIQHTWNLQSIDTMPICDVFNANGCEVAWNISGTTFLDTDSSCSTIADGIPISNLKMNLFDGGNNLLQQVIANWNGDYSFNTQLGAYSTSVDTSNIPFNVLCPSNNSIASNFTVIDSMDYNVDFRLVCKPGFDIGAWNIYRTHRFFPNDSTPIHAIAGDVTQSIYNVSCNSGISGEIKVVINGPANYFSPLAGALTPTLNGDTLIYTIADFSLVNAATDFAFNVITDATAQIGDQICFDVTVTPIPGDNNISNNTLTHCFAVSNSYDPNEKEVSPVGSLAYPYNDWLTYTIHFQNTGTAAAQHIQVLDTLDADLDASTFQLLSFSFAPLVQITGSDVAFDFININLPDSTTDLQGSQGYVSFRVKPLLNLPFGSFIQNTASIYFDFNSPVVTNTVSNLICNPTTSTTTATICEGDTYFFEGSNLTTAGNYTVTLQSVDGCDSILILNLIVDPTITNAIGATICSGVTFNFNGQQLSTAGIYHDTLTASTGCDSIVHLSLTVLPPVTASINQTICAGDSINFNGTMLDTTGIYADTLSTISGCDSIVTLHLSLINTVTHSLNANICQGDTFNFNGALLTATGIYYDTLSAATNCDSVVIMHLNAHELNASITLNGNTFSATGAGIIQWINCDSGTFVVDAIGSTFTPTVIGNYAAWVWDGMCSDTTECVFNGLTGVNDDLLITNSFIVFPNPTDESITIQFLKPCENCKLEITNTLGQIEFSAPINQKSEIINLKSVASGIYFLKVINSNGSIQVIKIVKQ